MHKSPATTSICVLFLVVTEKEKKKKECDCFFIGCLLLTDWWIFFLICFFYCRLLILLNRFIFSSNQRKDVWFAWFEQFIHLKEKNEIFSFREWCKFESIVICIRPSFMRTWTLITKYDCYLQRYAQQQHIGRHPGVSKMRPEWVNVFLSLSPFLSFQRLASKSRWLSWLFFPIRINTQLFWITTGSSIWLWSFLTP